MMTDEPRLQRNRGVFYAKTQPDKGCVSVIGCCERGQAERGSPRMDCFVPLDKLGVLARTG